MLQGTRAEDPEEIVGLIEEVTALTERLDWQHQLASERLHDALECIKEYNQTADDCNFLLRRLERAGFHVSTNTHRSLDVFARPEQRMQEWEYALGAQSHSGLAGRDLGESASSSSLQQQPQRQQQQQQQQQQQPPPQQQQQQRRQHHSLGAQRPLRQLKAGLTTIVVRNIPRGYTQDKFIREIMPDDTLDFVHLPHDPEKGGTVGYAFVNFVSHAAALEFQKKWHGRFLSKHVKTRALDITGSFVEGYEANLCRHLKSVTEDVDDLLLPAVFSCGVRGSIRDELERLGSRVADAARRPRQ